MIYDYQNKRFEELGPGLTLELMFTSMRGNRRDSKTDLQQEHPDEKI